MPGCGRWVINDEGMRVPAGPHGAGGGGELTVFRQLLVLITGLMLILLAGSFVVSVRHTQTFLEQQLHAHAQDTATSLGLSLAEPLARGDRIIAETMVSAIFDRGYYRRILVTDREGRVLVHRQSPLQLGDVPNWFQQRLPLKPPPGYSEVAGGWAPVAQLVVESHPGYGYRDLWHTALTQGLFFLVVWVLAMVLAWLALRWILRPLAAVEAQAEAICQQDFSEQATLPATPEFRRLVEAMNRLSRRLRAVIDDLERQLDVLRGQVYRDPLTGLGNLASFQHHFQALLTDSERRAQGALIILQVADFARFNQDAGRERADLLLQQIAGRWQTLGEGRPEALLARRNGADFIAFLPGVAEAEALQALAEVFEDVSVLPLLQTVQPPTVVHAGMSLCDVDGEQVELLPKASLAIRMAQSSATSAWHVLRASPANSRELALLGRDTTQWAMLLERVFRDESLRLHVMPNHGLDQRVHHREVLARLEVEGQLLSAAAFMPLIERFGWERRLDMMIVRKMVHWLKQARLIDMAVDRHSINLSPHSLRQPGFVEELLAVLAGAQDVAGRLLFEVSESALTLAPEAVADLAMRLPQLGSGLMVDRFGARQQSLLALGRLPLVAIKVDGVLVRQAEQSAEHRFLLGALVNITHGRDMLLLVDGVESPAQWQVLAALRVDGGQGFLFGQPQPLESLSA